jgi:hypothetical protein
MINYCETPGRFLWKVARTHRRSGGKDVCLSHSRDAAERR